MKVMIEHKICKVRIVNNFLLFRIRLKIYIRPFFYTSIIIKDLSFDICDLNKTRSWCISIIYSTKKKLLR